MCIHHVDIPSQQYGGIVLLHVFLKQVGDEIFGIFRDFIKGLILKVPSCRGDVGQRFIVIVPHERRQTAQPEKMTITGGAIGKLLCYIYNIKNTIKNYTRFNTIKT